MIDLIWAHQSKLISNLYIVYWQVDWVVGNWFRAHRVYDWCLSLVIINLSAHPPIIYANHHWPSWILNHQQPIVLFTYSIIVVGHQESSMIFHYETPPLDHKLASQNYTSSTFRIVWVSITLEAITTPQSNTTEHIRGRGMIVSQGAISYTSGAHSPWLSARTQLEKWGFRVDWNTSCA